MNRRNPRSVLTLSLLALVASAVCFTRWTNPVTASTSAPKAELPITIRVTGSYHDMG